MTLAFTTTTPSTTTPAIEASTVLYATGAANDSNCQWCRRLVALCDGRRTVQDISAALYLPVPVVQNLARKALTRGCVRL